MPVFAVPVTCATVCSAIPLITCTSEKYGRCCGLGLWFSDLAHWLAANRRAQTADGRKVDWLGFPLGSRSGGNTGHSVRPSNSHSGGRMAHRTDDQTMVSRGDQSGRRHEGSSGTKTWQRKDRSATDRHERRVDSRSVGRSSGRYDSPQTDVQAGSRSWGWTGDESTNRADDDRIGDRTWGQIIERNTKKARQRSGKRSRK